ncbi:hypothetical protein OA84_09255 [Kaistella solincola]|uniref:Uncharacterized protein n=1 Tax=Kaistella solincola TaxID=510955 RepID=A0ABR4ZSF0_9FLAO|nr:hypothetical protein OA84_09255 [Kaistella solincola]
MRDGNGNPFCFFAPGKVWKKQKDCNEEPDPRGWKMRLRGARPNKKSVEKSTLFNFLQWLHLV